MRLTRMTWLRATRALGYGLLAMAIAWIALAQGVSTTTVQGTVYLANGKPGAGTVQLSWPAFTTSNGLAVAAGRLTATIGTDGFVSVNLTPNLGATPAGLFYTAVYHMSDGTTSTEYWVVPAAAQATIASVRAQVMPAAQAVQAASKAYVDQAILSLASGSLTPVGGTLTGPLYLSGDPTQSLQAADKHYVDETFAQAMPLAGGAATGPLTATQLGAAWQADQFAGADFGAKLQACISGLSSTYGGTCDARNFSGTLAMASSVTIATANTTVLLPCATIATAQQIVVTAGTRNVSLRGCSLRGASAASGSAGGTVFLYSGAAAMIQVGDGTYAADTQGFHLDNAVINTTGATAATAQALVAYRTQELDLESLYLLGNANQTGMTLDGTGNYTGGTFYDIAANGFQVGINGIGHQAANAATTDWLNASTFVRVHLNCPTSSGSPIAGTVGINLVQGDGNTFTGGDVEGCATALHLGANAQNNTIVGLRNENSTNQIVADAGSAYNNWITGGTMFTGKLVDNGTRNSFLDTFHRTFNGIYGDWYGSQQDATVTNHFRLGTGQGNERGLLNRYQTDYGYRWTMGLTDATAGAQFYQVQDELNNVSRLSVGQYLTSTANTVTNVALNSGGCYSSSTAPTLAFSGGVGSGAAGTANMVVSSCSGGYAVGSVTMTSVGSGYTSQPTITWSGANQITAPSAVAEIATAGSTNNQTVINAAGTGAVVLNGSNNAGTGGVVIGSGGPSETTVATISNAGNANFVGTLQVGGTSTFVGSTTVRNQADAEIDAILQAGLTAEQKESFVYRDHTGASQWYLVKDQNNNWALNSALSGINAFKAYQSTNSGDTYVNASLPGGVVRLNYEPNTGTGVKIYGGNSSTLYAAFTGTAAIQFPGLAAASGHNCLQVDNSGYISNTGSACGSGGGGGSGTVGSGSAGQIAYYSASGTTLAGMNAVPVSAGGTGATTAAAALTALGGASLTTTSAQSFSGAITAPAVNANVNTQINVMAPPYNAKGDGMTDDTAAIQAAINDSNNSNNGMAVYLPAATFLVCNVNRHSVPLIGAGQALTYVVTKPGCDAFTTSDSSEQMAEGILTSDMTVLVDVTVNAAATAAGGNNTFPYRTSGVLYGTTALATPPFSPTNGYNEVFTNAQFTASSTTVYVPSGQFTSVPASMFVGLAVSSTGASWSSTIASVVDNTHITVAAAPTSTLMTDLTITGLPSMQAPWYFGNCAFAFPASDGANMIDGLDRWAFERVTIGQANSTTPNQAHSCGFFFQQQPYALHMKNVVIQQMYGGIVEAPPYKNNSSYFAWTPDTSAYSEIDIVGTIFPVVLYNGSHRTFTNLSIYGGGHAFTTGLWSFSDGSMGFSAATSADMEFIEPYNECWSNNQGEISRLSGNGNYMHGGSWTQCGPLNTTTLYGNNSYINTDSGSNWLVYGNNNNLVLPTYPTSTLVTNPPDQGYNNTIVAVATNAAAPASRLVSQPTPVNPSGQLDGSMINSGNTTTPYLNAQDLVITCSKLGAFTGGSGWTSTQNCTPDPTGTEISQSYVKVTGTSLTGFGTKSGGANWIPDMGIGTRFPLTKMYVQWQGRCVGASTCTASVTYSEWTTSGSTVIQACTLNFTSSWTFDGGPNSTDPCLLNLSSAVQGQMLGFNTGSWSGTGLTEVDVAFLAFQPISTDGIKGTANSGEVLLATGNGAEYKSSGKQLAGAGTGLTTGPTASVSGDVVTYTGTVGQVQDSGVALSSLAPLASPTFTGNTITLANAAAAEQDLVIKPGASADQVGAYALANYSGTMQWKLRKDASNYLRLTDAVNSLDREIMYQNGQTIINAGAGSNAVVINGTANSGAGGLLVQSGGSTPATVLTVTASGNTTVTGFVAGKSYMGSGTVTLAAGAAAGTSPTIACATSHVCDGVSGDVTLTTGTSPTTGTLATLTFPSAHTNYANCIVAVASSTAQLTTVTWSETAAAVTLTANSALTASTAYQVRYWCGGN